MSPSNEHPIFEVMRHDVRLPLYVEVDEIYNLACPASLIHYQHDPIQVTKTSVHGAINMLGSTKRFKARIFQASTSEVYGDSEVHPQDDPRQRQSNILLAKKELGCEPRAQLEDGLKEIIFYFGKAINV